MKKLLITLMVSAACLVTVSHAENAGEKVQNAITEGADVVAKGVGELTNQTVKAADEVKKGSEKQWEEFSDSADKAGDQLSKDTKELSNELNDKIQKDL